MGKPFNTNYPTPNDTQAWLKRIDSHGQANETVVGSFSTHGSHRSKCHQINERGTRVGSDLTRIGHGITRERLLESILQPNKEVSLHATWAIRTQDGKHMESQCAEAATPKPTWGSTEKSSTSTS